MKINKIFLAVFVILSIAFLVPINNVSALESSYMINNNGIQITKIEYHNLVNLGFTHSEILNMKISEFEKNKNLEGKIVSQTIKTLTSENELSNINNGISTFGIQNGSISTTEKTVVITIVSINGRYRYKVSATWTKIPSVRSYDIIAIGIDTTVKVYLNPTFQQNFCYSSGECSSSNIYTKNTSSVGLGASFKLPTSSLQSLSSYFYFDVEKRNATTLTTQNAYGDYAHAIKSISSGNANNYSVNRGGIALNSSITSYYDSMATAIAKWTGSW